MPYGLADKTWHGPNYYAVLSIVGLCGYIVPGSKHARQEFATTDAPGAVGRCTPETAGARVEC